MHARLTRALGTAVLSVGLLFTVAAPLPALAASTQVTATEGLNVRAAADAGAEIVGSLYRGQTVTSLGTEGAWTKISYPGVKLAYVATAYLTKGAELPVSAQVSTGVTKITTTDVNLRKGPGLSYGVIKVLKKGTKVSLTGKSARGFSQVVAGSKTGYVSAQYLTGAASGLPAVIGTRVATADLLIRTSSADNAKIVGEVKKGATLSVTGATANGRAQIVYKKAARWVTAKYLSNPDTTLPTLPTLPTITGSRYATAALSIRSTSTSAWKLIAEVPRGTRLSITGVVKNGRMQIVYSNSVRWVTAKYLSSTKPSTSTPPPGKASVEKGLKPNAVKTYRAVIARFPQITTVGGVHPDPLPDHPSGRALDFMIPNYKSAAGKKLGGEVAAWTRANAKSLGINYVIWNQHIWNITRDKEGWRYMASRGSDSANHKNHVHVTVYAAGLPGR